MDVGMLKFADTAFTLASTEITDLSLQEGMLTVSKGAKGAEEICRFVIKQL
jgi:hypothetical protein